MSQHALSLLVEKPQGGNYSPGFFSRLERGWASAALVDYIEISAVLGVAPGRLLGPDDAQRDVSEAEMTLIRLLRRMHMRPDEAIARLANLEPDAGLAG
jgi:hypothetical protein